MIDAIFICMGKLVGALDVGTTGTRCQLFTLDGKEVARSYKEWNSHYPQPGWVEQDADGWWEAVHATIVEATQNVLPEDIIAVAITNQRETIVPVDIKGNPLHKAIVWQDRRTSEVECPFIEEKLGADKIYKITGLTIDPYFSGSKILWIKNNKPEIYEKTYKFLLVHDFIAAKLTGKYVTDHSNASRTMLFDINSRMWSDEIANALEIDLKKMPTVMESGKEISTVLPEIAKKLGFSPSTKVICGAGDQQCAALGVGVVKPGTIKCTTGTGSFILGYAEKPTFDPQKRVLCSCHAVPGAWVQEASIFTSGATLRWARDTIGAAQKIESVIEKMKGNSIDPYDLITEIAEQSPVGSNGIITVPHFIGAGAPHWNPDARGVIFGIELGTKLGDLYRSVLEGVAFEVKKNLEIFQSLGISPSELRLTGGGSRSSLWNQIMADVLNITCVRGELEESTAVGAAILAAYGAGAFTDISKAAQKMSHFPHKWNPQPENTQKYEKLFSLSKKIYAALNEAGLYTGLKKFHAQ